MQINFLKQGYKKNTEFYNAFINNDLSSYGDKYIYKNNEDIIMDVKSLPDFPIYFAKETPQNKKKLFLQLIEIIESAFKNLRRENLLDELFWHSYLCIYKRDSLLETYPQIKKSQKEFETIVTKDFDWENYIYKGVLAFQYINKHIDPSDHKKYYNLILENFDVFNYIIKYEIFRNSDFLIKFLEIINETNTSKILKSRIKNRPDLGNDERYGRRVVYEFNKSYPIILSPMLEKDQLKEYFFKFLSYYYNNGDNIEEVIDEF